MSLIHRGTEFEDLSTEVDLSAAVDASYHQPVVIFKHSRICGLSYLAHREMSKIARESAVRVFRLVVQRSRPLAQRVEAELGIRHESPQAIVVFRGLPVFHSSHGRVTAERILAALSQSTAALE